MSDLVPDLKKWPPDFTVRISKRSKHIRLRVIPHTGLELVLPPSVSPDSAPDILLRNREWIRKTLLRVCGGANQPEEAFPPESLSLHGGERTLFLLWGQKKRQIQGDKILLRSTEKEKERAVGELQLWLREYASSLLSSRVAQLAAKHGMNYTALRFRRQKSRWGSCTAKGSLSLNLCLVFLPEKLMDYVLLHELAHTRQMNHGQAFWKTLFAMNPDALALDKRMRSAWKYVPSWVWL